MFNRMFSIIAGAYQLITSLWTHLHGWGWQAFNGILTLVMGGLILAQWPASGLWIIGLFIGIELIIYGCAWIMMALDLHKM